MYSPMFPWESHWIQFINVVVIHNKNYFFVYSSGYLDSIGVAQIITADTDFLQPFPLSRLRRASCLVLPPTNDNTPLRGIKHHSSLCSGLFHDYRCPWVVREWASRCRMLTLQEPKARLAARNHRVSHSVVSVPT